MASYASYSDRRRKKWKKSSRSVSSSGRDSTTTEREGHARIIRAISTKLVANNPNPDFTNFRFISVITQEPTGQSFVLRGKHKGSTSTDSAIKMFLTMKDFETEIAMLRGRDAIPRHRNIIQELEFYDSGAVKAIAYPFMTPLQGIVENEALANRPDKMTRYASGVAEGLAHLHAHGWAHLDIKIDNVMISSSDEATLIDFGMASRSTPGSDEIEGKGTLLYMAPEVLKVYLGRAISGGRGDRKKVDVFAYGCLLWAMLSGKLPWEDEMESFGDDVEAFQSHVQELVLRGDSLPITDSSWPHEHVAAMQRCLVSDYKERPNIRDVYPEGRGGGYGLLLRKHPTSPRVRIRQKSSPATKC